MLYKVVEKTKDKYIYELVDFSTHIQNENFSFSVKPGSYFLYACQNQEIISKNKAKAHDEQKSMRQELIDWIKSCDKMHMQELHSEMRRMKRSWDD